MCVLVCVCVVQLPEVYFFAWLFFLFFSFFVAMFASCHFIFSAVPGKAHHAPASVRKSVPSRKTRKKSKEEKELWIWRSKGKAWRRNMKGSKCQTTECVCVCLRKSQAKKESKRHSIEEILMRENVLCKHTHTHKRHQMEPLLSSLLFCTKLQLWKRWDNTRWVLSLPSSSVVQQQQQQQLIAPDNTLEAHTTATATAKKMEMEQVFLSSS